MLILFGAGALAGSSALSLEAGPTGPTVAGSFPARGAWAPWMSLTVVADPASLVAFGRGGTAFPIPLPGFGVGASRSWAVGPVEVRAGLGYNTLALHGSILAAMSEPGMVKWVVLGAAEGEAHVMIPALGPRTQLTFGVRPRGYGVLAATWTATAADPAVFWSFLGPTVGFRFEESPGRL